MGEGPPSGARGAAGYHLAGQPVTAPPLAPGLYVVATPIGNLRDITIRALETLAAADLILCEDTRTSAKLLDHYGIRTHRQALHEHNERERIAPVLERIAGGAAVALISDAGTPLLSDPGFPLVRAAQDAGHKVFAVPGASALLAALSVAGLPTDAFGFIGFLPPKAEARANAIAALRERRDTLVFYESPRRLVESLRAMEEGFGYDRPAAVALELTKRFERTYRGNLGSLVLGFEEMGEIKGEAVILVAGAPERIVDEAGWRAALAAALEDQPLRAAVDEITEAYGLKRKEVYDAALALKAESSTRIAAEGFGHRGEALAALYLRAKLYRIVARRVKTPVGEIDLIVRRFGVTVFVEVKTRGRAATEGDALMAVNQSRIVRAAEFYISRHPALAATPLRFDVIFLARGRWPRHIVNAFDATGMR